MSDYITEINTAHSKIKTSPEPLPLLSSSVSSALTYQAQDEHNPFYWQPKSPLFEPSRNRDTSSSAGASNVTAVTLNSLPVNKRPTDCELALRPDLVLQATFSEAQGGSGTASALIQVAGTELYSVKLGQRLVVNRDEKAAHQQGVVDVSEDLGKVTVITAQTVTLTPNTVSEQGCASEPAMVLSLYD